MGSGIATALLLSNYTVILKELNEKFLEAGIGRVRGEIQWLFIFISDINFDVFLILEWYLFWDRVHFCLANLGSRVKKGQMTQEKFEKTMSLLRGVLDFESFRDVDMVIEVVNDAL